MKLLFQAKTIAFSALLFAGLCSCERTTRTEKTTVTDRDDQDTITVTRRQTTAEDDLRDFRTWVKDKTTRADTSARKRWPEVKEGFKTRTSRLETRLDSLSADSKREYEELKAEYKAWETKNERRESQPLEEVKLNTFRQTLLGNYRDLKTMTAANAHATYQSFLQVVRGRKDNWTPDDWDYVDQVYGELNNRKSEIENDIATGDRVKIKALQTEYLGFEAAADAKDAYRNMRK